MQKYSMQSLWFLTLFTISACSSSGVSSRTAPASQSLSFGPAQMLGRPERNPSAPFLRYAPDGHRLFAIWSEDHDVFSAQGDGHSGAHHRMSGDRAPAPMRDALLAWSDDAGKTWSTPRRVNSALEAVQGEENGPKVAIGKDNKAYIVWSIPGEKGDKTRANIRFAMEDGNGGFTPATTLNEVKDAARFPILEGAPDGNLLVAWIDRRIDNRNRASFT